jgi:general secretion pathway protein K
MEIEPFLNAGYFKSPLPKGGFKGKIRRLSSNPRSPLINKGRKIPGRGVAMIRRRQARAAADQGGAVLLMVILVLALISVLVLSWGQEWRTELRLAANFREAHQCRRLAEAVFYYALGKLVSAKIEETALRSPAILQEAPAQPSTWHGDQRPHLLELPGGWAEIRVGDEAGKINLNRATEDTLVNLFAGLGVAPAQIQIMVASILDWRSRSDAPRPYGAKSDYYLSLDPPYVAKNSNFEVVEELAWVRGFENSPLIPRLHEWLTVQGVAAGVNVNTAPLPVLQAMGLAPDLSQIIIAARQTMPFRNIQEIAQLNPDPRLGQQQLLIFNSSPFFTIKSTGMVNKNKGKHSIKAVVRLNFSIAGAWDIVSWVDNFPG